MGFVSVLLHFTREVKCVEVGNESNKRKESYQFIYTVCRKGVKHTKQTLTIQWTLLIQFSVSEWIMDWMEWLMHKSTINTYWVKTGVKFDFLNQV